MRIFLYFFAFLSITECSKILGIFPLAGQSHYRAGLAIMKLLNSKGHDVTMVSPFKLKDLPEGWTDIILTPNTDRKMNFFEFNFNSYLQTFMYHSMGASMMNETLSDPAFKALLRSKPKFDVIILEQFYNEGLRYLGSHFDAPLILYSAQDANSWTNPSVGNPAPPSCVAEMLLPYTNEMTFFQRMDNAFFYVVNEAVRNFMLLPGEDKIIKEHFPGAPDITEYYKNISLVLLNGDTSVYEPVAKVPSMVDVGGFHLNPSKPLPADLQKVLDEAKNGVVYFSMGSNLRSADMPKEKIAMFIRVFSSLKQTILWKWEDEDLPGKPANVIVRKWMPQNDILAHKNVKLFITHGGIFGTLEAVNHGVPLLAFPIFGDQTLNAQRATAAGFARWLNIHDVTEDAFRSNLNEILTDTKYLENARKRSRILRDKPISARDKLVFWVEYVIRHKGAEHFRVAALKLNLFQYLLLDVIAFIVVSVLVLYVLLKRLVCHFWRSRSGKGTKTKTQ